MGKIKYILIGFLALIMVSCDGLFGVENNVGKPVVFGISQQNPKTRTAYSPNVDGQIEWRENDMVAIYMDWDDGNGYAGIPREKGIYKVSPGSKLHSEGKDYRYGRISYLSDDKLTWKGDFRENDGRAHEYPHTFWSVYPSNTPFANGKFEFSLPSNQDNINDVNGFGLAAYRKGVYSNTTSEGHVELLYSPMFTTLCVTIDNQANFPIGNELQLSSSDRMIAGSYDVDVSSGYNGVEGGNIKTISSNFKNGEATFFIIPREYRKNELFFLLGNETRPISDVLHAGYKYNIKITTKEVEVSGRMSDAAAQLIAGILGFGNGGQGLKDLMNQYLSGCYPDPNYFNNTVWNNFLNNIRSKLPNVTAADFDMFSDNEWECIKQLLRSLTKLEVNNGNYLNAKLTKKDFELFPNIEEIEMLYEQNVEIELNGWPKLKTVVIKGNGKVILTVSNCPALISITLNANKESRADVDKVTCPNYKET